MQIQVADIRADKAGIGQPYLCVHVGSVHIYLCPAGMDDVADFRDFRLEDAMRRGVGYHQGGKLIPVFFRFAAKVVHVHIAVFVAGACYDAETGLYG